MRLQGLYAITDEVLTPFETIESQVKHAIARGATVVQFRYKQAITPEVEAMASRLLAITRTHGSLLIINDHLELALRIGADGIHVGIEDWDDLTLLRKFAGSLIVGVSCYGDIERAKIAEASGVDYVAFGAFYPSSIKPHALTVPFELIPQAKRVLQIPICAIGGITFEKSTQFYDAGCDMVAMISDMWR